MTYQQIKFSRIRLRKLLSDFRAAVKRKRPNDAGLADAIEQELLSDDPGQLTLQTTKRLARWCKTDGNPYQEAMPVAQEISELLFGEVIDRKRLNT